MLVLMETKVLVDPVNEYDEYVKLVNDPEWVEDTVSSVLCSFIKKKQLIDTDLEDL